MNQNSTFLVLLGVGLALVLGLLLFAGGGSEQAAADSSSQASTPTLSASSSETGGAFTVDAGVDTTVEERETVQLAGRVSGAAGGAVSYHWTAQGGLGVFSDPYAKDPVYTAPSVCGCEDCVLLRLTVTDGRGRTASDAFVLTVRNPLACPPDPCPPRPVCPPVDPCARGIDETCPQPEVPCASPCITEVPPVDSCGSVIGPCPCIEGDCAFIWTASPFDPGPGRPADRPKPRIVRQYPSQIDEGSSFALRGTISNPACASGCYVWAASKGTLEGADTLSPTYRAPMTDRPHGESVTISLTLYDGSGGRSYDQIRLTIDNLDYDGPAVP